MLQYLDTLHPRPSVDTRFPLQWHQRPDSECIRTAIDLCKNIPTNINAYKNTASVTTDYLRTKQRIYTKSFRTWSTVRSRLACSPMQITQEWRYHSIRGQIIGHNILLGPFFIPGCSHNIPMVFVCVCVGDCDRSVRKSPVYALSVTSVYDPPQTLSRSLYSLSQLNSVRGLCAE